MRNLNRVHLSGLRAVEAVGRLGNLAAAAEELGVTAGAVSQQLQRTEEALGVLLFVRRPKGLAPTALGHEICAGLSSGMAELSRAVALADRDSQTTLTVSVAPVFAGKWLVWRLSKFHEQASGVRVRIDADTSLVDPTIGDVDACIRVGKGKWPGVDAEWLLDQRVFPVCHPRMAAELKTPADLAKVPIIREPHSMFGWDVWLKPNGLDENMLGEGPVYSDASLCLDAAVAGQGVFLGWETLASDSVRMGRLAAPFPDRYETGDGYWFVTARGVRPSRHALQFRDWLKDELMKSVGQS